VLVIDALNEQQLQKMKTQPGFIAALAIPRSSPQVSRNFGMAMSLATFVASLGLLFWFDRAVRGQQPYIDFNTGYTPGFFAFGKAVLYRVNCANVTVSVL